MSSQAAVAAAAAPLNSSSCVHFHKGDALLLLFFLSFDIMAAAGIVI